MAGDSLSTGRPSLQRRLAAFLAERHPFAVEPVISLLAGTLRVRGGSPEQTSRSLERLRLRATKRIREELVLQAPPNTPETTPGVAAGTRLRQAVESVVDEIDGFLRREAIAASLTAHERRELLHGMILTRATDNRLKAFFLGGEVRYGKAGFQGKGFRSLGQEAIYAVPLRLRRGESFRGDDGDWKGDVVAPLIRDVGVALAMHPEAETVRMVLNAQMGKAGPPTQGKDLHIGDLSRGILPATAPLSIPAMTAAGMAMGFARRGEDRVAVCFIGEGGSSLGEWHEAVNLSAASRLPIVFCVQNNQTALSTPVRDQSAVRVFADKAAGYGIPGLTLDGTDPEAIAAAFAWAAERARAGAGPTLIELVSMRMCGHAHHDDMLYLGRESQPSWDYPRPTEQGYVDRDAWDFWSGRDPIPRYAARLREEGLIGSGELERLIRQAEELVAQQAREVIDAPWPDPSGAGAGVLADEGTVPPLRPRGSDLPGSGDARCGRRPACGRPRLRLRPGRGWHLWQRLLAAAPPAPRLC
jgi:TPP-dependent pyruvate/acetoin dehydrogenase alpha subunit